MRCEWVTEPRSDGHPNDDYAATAAPAPGRGGTVVLLDGVSTRPGESTGCGHGTPWYTARLGGALLHRCGSRPDLPLTECLVQAIDETARGHGDGCELSHPRTPQATVVAARWDATAVEYLVLCDSVLLIQRTDGRVLPVLDTRLDEVWAAARTAVPYGERAAFIEARRNAEDGFFTAAADPSVAHRAVTGTLPRAGVRALAALTDGASRWTEVFRLGDWEALFAVLAEKGPREVIAQVRAAERADPSCTAFPRGKIHDDATAALAEL
ncbi:protein phosphatase 2C domain-containing protein [Streptomyces aidingensis]|uniref:Protein phosphatase 2C n=1 Tax=Streptomyces aidingensis TaxID=910347 RepID=A0A1I1TMR1_9ACTN|nr:protein phosphatase 2C domain-containing protein [Streptomyces aidingensis]SFD59797.1 Protein phosphatase 2C [Streptomyces aidingensis]